MGFLGIPRNNLGPNRSFEHKRGHEKSKIEIVFAKSSQRIFDILFQSTARQRPLKIFFKSKNFRALLILFLKLLNENRDN